MKGKVFGWSPERLPTKDRPREVRARGRSSSRTTPQRYRGGMQPPYRPPERLADVEHVALTIRFPRTQHERLRQLSFTSRRHMSALLRDAIGQYLDRHTQPWPQDDQGPVTTPTAKTGPSS